MNNLMVGIETLSSREDAAILSLGAVFFNTKLGSTHEAFHAVIKPSSKYFGHIDPDTVIWWMKQSDDARGALFENTKASELRVALANFSEFTFRNNGAEPLKVWSKSPNFDLTIVRNAMKRTNQTAPWEYWNERDVRTCLDLGNLMGVDIKKRPDEDTEHSAIGDAIYQAKQVIDVYEHIEMLNDLKE